MFKRNKGYLLLTLLVLTGLAGRMHSDSLTAKERHALITSFKSSRQTLLQYSTALEQARTKKQRTFAQQRLYETAGATVRLWEQTKTAIHMRLLRNDTSTSAHVPAILGNTGATKKHHKPSFNSAEEALKAGDRAYVEIIKYLRTTTENPKRYLVPMGKDTINVYDAIRMIAAAN